MTNQQALPVYLFVCFVALRPKSTAMVMAGRSVHLQGVGHSNIFIRLFFGAQNFEFQYFWGFQKNEYFLGYEECVDIFWGSSQSLTVFRGHFYAF